MWQGQQVAEDLAGWRICSRDDSRRWAGGLGLAPGPPKAAGVSSWRGRRPPPDLSRANGARRRVLCCCDLPAPSVRSLLHSVRKAPQARPHSRGSSSSGELEASVPQGGDPRSGLRQPGSRFMPGPPLPAAVPPALPSGRAAAPARSVRLRYPGEGRSLTNTELAASTLTFICNCPS